MSRTQVFVDVGDLKGLAFEGKSESFRLLQRFIVHISTNLSGGQNRFVWHPEEPRLVTLVVEDDGSCWTEETQILLTRRFILDTKRLSRLTFRIMVDDEADRMRCLQTAPGGKTWIPVTPESVMELVEEAKVFWNQRLG